MFHPAISPLISHGFALPTVSATFPLPSHLHKADRRLSPRHTLFTIVCNIIRSAAHDDDHCTGTQSRLFISAHFYRSFISFHIPPSCVTSPIFFCCSGFHYSCSVLFYPTHAISVNSSSRTYLIRFFSIAAYLSIHCFGGSTWRHYCSPLYIILYVDQYEFWLVGCSQQYYLASACQVDATIEKVRRIPVISIYISSPLSLTALQRCTK